LKNFFEKALSFLMKIVHVVGARPNFMKVAPVMSAISQLRHFDQTLVHTGQHYDANMSDIFFQQLGIPAPDINLGIGAGSPVAQTAQIMLRFEEIVATEKPGLTLVYGDVTSTIAAALVSVKNGIPVGHVEAGLRSRDRSMPEEINRLLTDQISNILFTPSEDGSQNLVREGVDARRVYFVGNVMIDTLVRLLPQAKRPEIQIPEKYVLVTLHRPSNVDEPTELRRIAETLVELSRKIPVIFPVHPRTRQKLMQFDFSARAAKGFTLIEPVGYLEFLALQRNATAVITDSGGIQEETTFLGVPCITVRENTERPITVKSGTNVLVGRDMRRLTTEVDRILGGDAKRGTIPALWDGRAGERIAEILAKEFNILN
jgi:UDP-N-acetylglucosamine 2-epimerase (non-hydrolysing)